MTMYASTSLASFQPLTKLGEGSYSSVYKVRRLADNQLYALKKVRLGPLSSKQIDNALNQVRLLASIESPFIVGFRQAFFESGGKLLCIVMELATQGDLKQMIEQHNEEKQCFSESQIWKAAAHISSGLALLHENGILHRDLKTANIFMTDLGNYAIADMNVSKVQAQQQLAYTQTGTPYYASPQIWKDQPYGPKSDIWSFGCIIYEMCTGRPPFEGPDMASLYQKIKKGKYEAIPAHYSKQLANFIAQCLKIDPDNRPTAEEIMKKGEKVRKRCRQLGLILPRKRGKCRLLEVISSARSNSFLQKEQVILPSSRYETSLELRMKSQTNETCIERSCDSGGLSTGIGLQSNGLLSARGNKHHHKLKRKLSKLFKSSKQKTEPSDKTPRVVGKIQSLGSIATQRKNLKPTERSKTEQAAKLPKLQGLNRRKQPTTEQSSGGQLEVIMELRSRLDGCRRKLQKVSSVGTMPLDQGVTERKPSIGRRLVIGDEIAYEGAKVGRSNLRKKPRKKRVKVEEA